MAQNFNIANFLHNLEQNQPKSRDSKPKSDVKIEKVYLSHPDWQGKYQILPMVSAENGLPMAFLQRVREIKLPRKVTLNDGKEIESVNWIKILPPEAYTMQSADGQTVSSLTSADEDLLRQVQSSFDILYGELGGMSKERNPELNKTIGYMRRRNYTLFYGRCVSHWGASDPRNPKHANFSALFVCSAKNFPEVIQNNINDSVITYGDPETWINQVYSRELTGRTGFLLFSINLNAGGQVGYSLSAQHVINNQQVSSQVIPEEEAELMHDPIEGYLGWQADHREPGRLFNRRLMEETLATINQQIAAARASKGIDPGMAAAATSGMAFAGQGVNTPQTNDPMLQGQGVYAQPAGMTNPEAVMNGNTNPFQTPPAAQIDPLTQAPVNNGPGAQFVSPAFAQGGNNLPF